MLWLFYGGEEHTLHIHDVGDLFLNAPQEGLWVISYSHVHDQGENTNTNNPIHEYYLRQEGYYTRLDMVISPLQAGMMGGCCARGMHDGRQRAKRNHEHGMQQALCAWGVGVNPTYVPRERFGVERMVY